MTSPRPGGGRRASVAAAWRIALRLALGSALTAAAMWVGGCVAISGGPGAAPGAKPLAFRPLTLTRDGRWLGEGVAYGPHRDGQRPGGATPTREQLREDLRLIARDWSTIRIYGSVGAAPTILDVIRKDRLGLHVMLGAWIAVEESVPDSAGAVRTFPAAKAENRREVDDAVRLANAYPDVVTSVCVGNETQVSWSDHRSPPAVLIAYLREIRSRTKVPVTTADDFNFWNKPEAQAVAAEVDFLTLHAHPLWNGLSLEDALGWTQRTLADIRSQHPGRAIVFGECGWATQRGTAGDQGKLMKGRVGEPEQAVFFAAWREWVRRERVPSYFFEAFDENWKGGDSPEEVEKHWGLYRADRTPKAAMAGAH